MIRKNCPEDKEVLDANLLLGDAIETERGMMLAK
jgi:hypothetical protein